MKLTIKVTDEHIANGKHFTKCTDPIALAANNAADDQIELVRAAHSSVDATEARLELLVGSEKRYYRYPLPASAQSFIKTWEKRGKCEPFEFAVELEQYTPKLQSTMDIINGN